MKALFTALLLASLAACGLQKPAESTERDLRETHFFTAPAESHWFASPVPFAGTDLAACRARLESLVCLAGAPEPGGNNANRACIPTDTRRYAEPLEKIFDAYPPTLQKVFCGLGKIWIEQNFKGTAYAGTTPDGSMAIMGIRESALIGDFPLAFWTSWKEQLSFGGIKDRYELTPGLPVIEATLDARGANDFLYYVIAHEFGHVLDFANKVNSYDCPQDPANPEAPCPATPGTWSAISWEAMIPREENLPGDPWGLQNWVLKPASQFAHREALCFYDCATNNASVVPALYAGLWRTDFLTTYATTNSWDDFAESVAFWVGAREAGLKYGILLGDGTFYPWSDKLEAPVFARKRAYLDAFLTSPTLRYPGVNQP
jgi:hypothetical protein